MRRELWEGLSGQRAGAFLSGRRTGALLWAAGVLLWAAGVSCFCFGRPGEPEISWRVAAVMPDGGNSFWREASQGALDAARDCGLKLTFYPYDTNAMESVMNESLEKAILSQVDGILLSANQCSGESTRDLLSRAKEQGIRVVLCDTDCDACLRDAFVGTDDWRGGEQAAREIMEQQGLRRVLVMVKSQEYLSDASRQRLQAFCETIRKGDLPLELVKLPEEGEGYYEQLQDTLLACEPDTAVVCLNTGFSFLVAQTISRLELEDKLVLLGFGGGEEALPYLENGSLDLLFSQSSYDMGVRSMEVMETLLSGEETGEDYYMDFQVMGNEVSGFDY